MLRSRIKSAVSVAALLALLAISGARTLHAETWQFEHIVTRAAVVNATPCWFCDSPDCALLPAAVPLAVPAAGHAFILSSEPLAHAHFEDFSHQVRSPPAI